MQSSIKRNQFERMGEFVLICINESVETVNSMHDDDEEATTQYCYDSAKVRYLSSRSEVIQAIIRIKYPDIESEFAAKLNGGDDDLSHTEWRVVAKSIADEFEAFISEDLAGNE